MPAVLFFAYLNLEQKLSFIDGHEPAPVNKGSFVQSLHYTQKFIIGVSTYMPEANFRSKSGISVDIEQNISFIDRY